MPQPSVSNPVLNHSSEKTGEWHLIDCHKQKVLVTEWIKATHNYDASCIFSLLTLKNQQNQEGGGDSNDSLLHLLIILPICFEALFVKDRAHTGQ